MRREVGNRVAQAAAEPRGQLRLEAHLGQIVDDRLLEIVRLPTDRRVVGAGVVVGAPIIDVLIDAAPFELAADAFARDRLAAVLAPEQTAGKRVLGSACATVLPIQHCLAGVERGPVDQPLVVPLEDLPVPMQFANIEAVAEDVRECCAVEPGLAVAVDVTLAPEHVGERLEGVAARGVEIEDADQSPRPLRVGFDGFVFVFDVEVTVGGDARRPSLAHLLVHPLEHFRPEIVAVVLGNRGHHVERQRTSSPWAELVIDEGQLDAAAVFEFLQADRVAHVAADSVELMAEDRLNLLFLGVGLHPREHLVEREAFRTAFGGFGHDKLADDVPTVGLRPFAVHAKLSIEGIAFFLLAGGYPRPHDDVHFRRFSSSARNRTSASLRTFVRISMASSSLITRP